MVTNNQEDDIKVDEGTGTQLRTLAKTIATFLRHSEVTIQDMMEPYLPTLALYRRPLLKASFNLGIEFDVANLWVPSQSTALAGATTNTSQLFGYETYKDIPPSLSPTADNSFAITPAGSAAKAGLKRNIPIGGSSIIEIELVWTNFGTRGATHFFYFGFHNYDNVNRNEAFVRYDWGNEKWQYFNGAGGWTDITGGGQALNFDTLSTGTPGTTRAFHKTKLAVDFSKAAPEYVYMISDGLVLDMNGIVVEEIADTTETKTDLVLECEDTNANVWYWKYLKVFELVTT